jgi:hypothetical protein
MFVILLCHPHLRRLSNHWVRVSDLNDGWTSRDGLVSDAVLAGSQDNVALAVDSFRDGDLEVAINWGDISVDGASNCDEGSVDFVLPVLGSKNVARGVKGDNITRLNGTRSADAEGWESLERELGLGSVAVWAGDDEASGESVDLIEGQWIIEWLWKWGLLVGGTDISAMA